MIIVFLEPQDHMQDNASTYLPIAHKKRSCMERASSMKETAVEMDNTAESVRERSSKAPLKLLLYLENLLNPT